MYSSSSVIEQTSFICCIAVFPVLNKCNSVLLIFKDTGATETRECKQSVYQLSKTSKMNQENSWQRKWLSNYSGCPSLINEHYSGFLHTCGIRWNEADDKLAKQASIMLEENIWHIQNTTNHNLSCSKQDIAGCKLINIKSGPPTCQNNCQVPERILLLSKATKASL